MIADMTIAFTTGMVIGILGRIAQLPRWLNLLCCGVIAVGVVRWCEMLFG